jgi:prevent-host-death family protein
MKLVPASEFARNFGRYREAVQREPVAVTSHGRATGYFVSAETFGEYQELKAMARRVYSIAELPRDYIDAIAGTRMDPKFEYLNKLLDEK